MSDIMHLCTMPGPSCPVDSVKGGAGGALQSLSWSRTVMVVGGWRASVGNGAIGAVCLCAMPGPLDPVDKGMEGVWLVASDHGHRGGGHWWVVSRSQRAITMASLGMVLALPLFTSGQQWGARAP